MPNDFQTAYQQAYDRVGSDVWHGLAVSDRTALLYQELRFLDAEQFLEKRSRCSPPVNPSDAIVPRLAVVR
jgi:hypothetical protein